MTALVLNVQNFHLPPVTGFPGVEMVRPPGSSPSSYAASPFNKLAISPEIWLTANFTGSAARWA